MKYVRYSDTKYIYQIKRLDPDIKLKFPGKRLLGDNFSAEFVKKRMKSLDHFIKNALEFTSVLKW